MRARHMNRDPVLSAQGRLGLQGDEGAFNLAPPEQSSDLRSQRSPLGYPIDYRQASKTPIELHPAATAVYRDAESKGLPPR